jgi:hypothetical protein
MYLALLVGWATVLVALHPDPQIWPRSRSASLSSSGGAQGLGGVVTSGVLSGVEPSGSTAVVVSSGVEVVIGG